MIDLLAELQDVLDRHNATIIRSQNATNSLVVSVQSGPTTYVEVEFEEDIDPDQIIRRNYEYIRMA
jgi:hypothetical protein